MRNALAALVLAALVVVGAKAFGDAGGAEGVGPRIRSAVALGDAGARLPPPAQPAFTVGRPRSLDRREARSRFAPVLRRVTALARPRADAEPVVTVERETEEGTTNVVLVLGEARTRGAAWVRVRLPVLPNGRTGWVRRSALGGYGGSSSRGSTTRSTAPSPSG
jgi:hypothetical protein